MITRRNRLSSASGGRGETSNIDRGERPRRRCLQSKEVEHVVLEGGVEMKLHARGRVRVRVRVLLPIPDNSTSNRLNDMPQKNPRPTTLKSLLGENDSKIIKSTRQYPSAFRWPRVRPLQPRWHTTSSNILSTLFTPPLTTAANHLPVPSLRPPLDEGATAIEPVGRDGSLPLQKVKP